MNKIHPTTALFCLIKLSAAYLVIWSISYSIILSFEYADYFHYLYLSWATTGSIPGQIQMIAVVTLAIGVAIYSLIPIRDLIQKTKSAALKVASNRS